MTRVDESVGKLAEVVDVTASESGRVAQKFEGGSGWENGEQREEQGADHERVNWKRGRKN